MNVVKEIQRINAKELEIDPSGSGSWHEDYKNSAYIFYGGLSYDLTEGDIITIFSQYGNIVDVNLIRDKETGKSKGFGFLAYEDQRSTILAVDNFNGAKILSRVIRVDHCKDYKSLKEKQVEPTIEELGHTRQGDKSTMETPITQGLSLSMENRMPQSSFKEKPRQEEIPNSKSIEKETPPSSRRPRLEAPINDEKRRQDTSHASYTKERGTVDHRHRPSSSSISPQRTRRKYSRSSSRSPKKRYR